MIYLWFIYTKLERFITGPPKSSPWRQRPSQDLCPTRQITLSPVFGLMAQKPRITTAHVGRILGTPGLQRFKVFRNPAGQSKIYKWRHFRSVATNKWVSSHNNPQSRTELSWRGLSSAPCWQEMILIGKMPVTNFRVILYLFYIHLYFVPVKFKVHYISYVSLTNVSQTGYDLLSVSKRYWY